MDDNVAVIGDWVPPSPSPRTFFSSILGEDIGAKQLPSENSKSEGLLLGAPEWMNLSPVGSKETRQVSAVGNNMVDSGLSMDQRSNSRGGLGERIAARAGFSAPKLNTEGIRPTDLSVNTEVQSPYLTIPPGLSPTMLLESPVFLSNSLVQPSPTTGKFPFFPNNVGKGSGLWPDTSDAMKKDQFEDSSSSSFAFRPLGDLGGSPFFGSGSQMTQAMLPQQSFPRMDALGQSDSSFQSCCAEQSKVLPHNGTVCPTLSEHSRPLAERESAIHGISFQQRSFRGNLVVSGPDHSPPLDDQGDEEGHPRGGAIDPMVGDVGGGPAEDGYNWRKYGQKQVKGSEFPRSYYKCTHTNCPVKKKVERSQEGHITEIIYKGSHNHPKPAPNRRPVIGEPCQMLLEHDGDPGWANMQKAATAGAADWRKDNNLEVTSSPSEGPEVGNPAASLPAQYGTRSEAADQADGSSTFSNDEGEDDQQTHGSVSMGYDGDGDGDESESKRRKIEAYATDMSGATRAVREPRVVVQTTSEVDILDDGYRWRKYGQKVVKGNPNPRSYYKCTSAGCTVRKHVERASHDLKSVITTYEGKHNHDVPASRNSSHANSGPSQSAASASAILNHAHRPESSQMRSMMARFDGPASLGSFNVRAPVLGSSHGFSFGMGQPSLANLGTSSQGKLPMIPVHPFLMQQQQQQHPANEMGLMLQKGEQKVEPESSAAYQQMMNRLPLGHQM